MCDVEIRDTEVVILEASHFLVEDQPEQVADILSVFLQQPTLPDDSVLTVSRKAQP